MYGSEGNLPLNKINSFKVFFCFPMCVKYANKD